MRLGTLVLIGAVLLGVPFALSQFGGGDNSSSDADISLSANQAPVLYSNQVVCQQYLLSTDCQPIHYGNFIYYGPISYGTYFPNYRRIYLIQQAGQRPIVYNINKGTIVRSSDQTIPQRFTLPALGQKTRNSSSAKSQLRKTGEVVRLRKESATQAKKASESRIRSSGAGYGNSRLRSNGGSSPARSRSTSFGSSTRRK